MKNSKLLACLLCLAMLLTACVGASAEVYEGSSIGMQGTVTVAMTVEDGVIKNVELTECHETANIAGVAMERLPQLMVEHQTTTLDAVTGATLASNAIMRAAANAAKAAGVIADKMLCPVTDALSSTASSSWPPLRKTIWQALDTMPQSMDEIADTLVRQKISINVQMLMQELVFLELEGAAGSVMGRYYRKTFACNDG